MKIRSDQSPKARGYRFPAEWEKHHATWLSWPHNLETWPGERLNKILPAYLEFIKVVSQSEKVRINLNGQKEQDQARLMADQYQINSDQLEFFHHPTNDCWCRDHGPAFLVNSKAEAPKILINWEYNAWGGKYPPFDQDNLVPLRMGKSLDLPVVSPGIIMEGGSVEFNGTGTIITTASCLLNKNRNPHLAKLDIEKYLVDFYGADQIIWLHEGIAGDDTDGHVDDITRFVNADTVITVYEDQKSDDNYQTLKKNIDHLKCQRLLNGKQLNIIEIPMPKPVFSEGLRLPASYANFYFANQALILPTYQSKQDQYVLEMLKQVVTDREVIGIDSTEIIWGLGSFHCLSQQEPFV